MLEKPLRPKKVERFDFAPSTRRICHRLTETRRVNALTVKFLLDYFTRLCRNTALKQT
jgi:hypothetical protein